MSTPVVSATCVISVTVNNSPNLNKQTLTTIQLLFYSDLSGGINFLLKHNYGLQLDTDDWSSKFRYDRSLKMNFKSHFSIKETENWSDVKFQDLDETLALMAVTNKHFHIIATRSPRDLILKIQKNLGVLCNSFLSRQENDSIPGLPSWTTEELTTITLSMASICILLSWLATVCDLKLSTCISDKMTKNEKKYPVHLAKGSAAKYTAYANRVALTSFGSKHVVLSIVVVLASVVMVLKKRSIL